MCKQIKLRTSYDTEEPETFYSNGEGEGCGVGGGGEEGNTRLRTLQSRIPPPLFLTSPPLPFFQLQNIVHCCVISPISLSSPAALSSPNSRTHPRPPPPKKNTHTHTHTFHSWLFSLYLDFLPLRLLRLRNIEHYFVA